MLTKTNIEEKLEKTRNKRISEKDILKEVEQIFSETDIQRAAIKQKLKSNSDKAASSIDLKSLDSYKIYHIKDIQKICVDYRLRFLDSKYFKGEIPEEAVSKIRELENKHQTSLHTFKIIAPAKLLKLENADDPLLFTPLGNDYYYLIHKWGNDLHPLRKTLMWPYKTLENLVITIFFISLMLTAITPIHLFSTGPTEQEYILLFLFMLKAVGGMVIYYGFAKGKNFNSAIWNSKYYNA
ncbi:hypothetical protein INR76_09200 [Marixanthomonas sp. SCSIO 43207]|uniref:hypothetical protein n=1 Tax=Marixanthomonas sp. SCSIO 43207 TaxID=2779360 RepID=UPI001CA7E716|nr:hypothetical protein [Marixanthomonas sp. SCSIO 43207]UAB80292.1 hypothetical protein INR76_09200 [Marixanthomonas sp. SCSIO 43207]